MPLPWIKMWLEALDDPKLTRLSLAERGAWWGILKLAGKCHAGGKIVSGGLGLDIDEIADALHIKSSGDRQALDSMIAKMEKRGSLRRNESVLIVVHYEERQRIPPSATPEAVAERVRRHRGRLKEGAKGKITPEEEAIIHRFDKLGGWQTDDTDIPWLRDFRVEFPDFSPAELKACLAYHSGRSPPKHKGIWKNRFRNWMIKKQEIERRNKTRERPEGPKQERRRPITYIRGSEQAGPEDKEDMP